MPDDNDIEMTEDVWDEFVEFVYDEGISEMELDFVQPVEAMEEVHGPGTHSAIADGHAGEVASQQPATSQQEVAPEHQVAQGAWAYQLVDPRSVGVLPGDEEWSDDWRSYIDSHHAAVDFEEYLPFARLLRDQEEEERETAAREAAAREAAARQAAEREAAEREAAEREAAEREAAERELAEWELAQRELAEREAAAGHFPAVENGPPEQPGTVGSPFASSLTVGGSPGHQSAPGPAGPAAADPLAQPISAFQTDLSAIPELPAYENAEPVPQDVEPAPHNTETVTDSQPSQDSQDSADPFIEPPAVSAHRDNTDGRLLMTFSFRDRATPAAGTCSAEAAVANTPTPRRSARLAARRVVTLNIADPAHRNAVRAMGGESPQGPQQGSSRQGASHAGPSSQHATSHQNTSQAGSSRQSASQAGSSRQGSSQAGSSHQGSTSNQRASQPGSSQQGTSRQHASQPDNSHHGASGYNASQAGSSHQGGSSHQHAAQPGGSHTDASRQHASQPGGSHQGSSYQPDLHQHAPQPGGLHQGPSGQNASQAGSSYPGAFHQYASQPGSSLQGALHQHEFQAGGLHQGIPHQHALPPRGVRQGTSRQDVLQAGCSQQAAPQQDGLQGHPLDVISPTQLSHVGLPFYTFPEAVDEVNSYWVGERGATLNEPPPAPVATDAIFRAPMLEQRELDSVEYEEDLNRIMDAAVEREREQARRSNPRRPHRVLNPHNPLSNAELEQNGNVHWDIPGLDPIGPVGPFADAPTGTNPSPFGLTGRVHEAYQAAIDTNNPAAQLSEDPNDEDDENAPTRPDEESVWAETSDRAWESALAHANGEPTAEFGAISGNHRPALRHPPEAGYTDDQVDMVNWNAAAWTASNSSPLNYDPMGRLAPNPDMPAVEGVDYPLRRMSPDVSDFQPEDVLMVQVPVLTQSSVPGGFVGPAVTPFASVPAASVAASGPAHPASPTGSSAAVPTLTLRSGHAAHTAHTAGVAQISSSPAGAAAANLANPAHDAASATPAPADNTYHGPFSHVIVDPFGDDDLDD